MNIAVIGNGAWGGALAGVARKRGHSVKVWGRHPKKDETGDLSIALKDAECVILSIPSHAMREICTSASIYLTPETLLVSVAKGIEESSGLRMSTVISDVIPTSPVLALSGPSFAEEVMRGLPAALVCASANDEAAKTVQTAFSGGDFRVYTNADLVGVELGGALKNVMAIAAGACFGLGLGVNAQAALITRGMSELVRVGTTLGGLSQTFYGLSGLGDLILTCSSSLSRNRWAGEELGRGRKLNQIISSKKGTIEGIRTSRSIYRVIREKAIQAPILTEVYAILYEDKPVSEALQSLMVRELKSEY